MARQHAPTPRVPATLAQADIGAYMLRRTPSFRPLPAPAASASLDLP